MINYDHDIKCNVMSATTNVLKYISNTCIGKLDHKQDEYVVNEKCGQSEKPTTKCFFGIK